MDQKIKYHKNLETGSIYRSRESHFSDGSPTLELERWNWDMENWSGHIHDYEKTMREIEEGILIVPITKEETFKIIKE